MTIERTPTQEEIAALLERRAFERQFPPRFNTKGERLCVACFGRGQYDGIRCVNCLGAGIDPRYPVMQPRAESCMQIARLALAQAAEHEAAHRADYADVLGNVAACAVEAAINIEGLRI